MARVALEERSKDIIEVAGCRYVLISDTTGAFGCSACAFFNHNHACTAAATVDCDPLGKSGPVSVWKKY